MLRTIIATTSTVTAVRVGGFEEEFQKAQNLIQAFQAGTMTYDEALEQCGHSGEARSLFVATVDRPSGSQPAPQVSTNPMDRSYSFAISKHILSGNNLKPNIFFASMEAYLSKHSSVHPKSIGTKDVDKKCWFTYVYMQDSKIVVYEFVCTNIF